MAKFLVTEATLNMESLLAMFSVPPSKHDDVSLNFRAPALKV